VGNSVSASALLPPPGTLQIPVFTRSKLVLRGTRLAYLFRGMDFHDEFIMAIGFVFFAKLALFSESFNVVLAGVVCLLVCAHFVLLFRSCGLIEISWRR
jgi:hypothetical protein